MVKTSQGVANDLGEEVLPKGKKYTMKMLNAVDDFAHLVSGSWTTDKATNHMVADLLAQLQDQIERPARKPSKG